MRILTSVFGSSAADTYRGRAARVDQELPMKELYQLLWAYYLNNGLYEDLRQMGYYLSNANMKEIYNPAFRAAEFFVDTIWSGPVDKALPIVAENPGDIEVAIEQIWNWSNWEAKKSVAVRWAAVLGDVYFRIARPLAKDPEQDPPERVYIQLIRPEYVTEREADERDYLTYVRFDIPQERKVGRQIEAYYQTEEWTPDLFRIWHHKSGPEREIGELGIPIYEVELKAWGLDFIPVVQAKHIDLGDNEGVGSFVLSLSKINELNRLATRLHQILFRHNDVTWALQSNMLDSSGRPIPAPRIRDTTTPGADGEVSTVELGGERMVRLPGQATLAPLVPGLDYGSHLGAVQGMIEELERDLPQLTYYKLKDLPEMSGKALRLLLMPALAKAQEARANLDAALIRAHKIALTIGNEIGAFSGLSLGTYENGDFDHTFGDRPLISMNRFEVAELATTETAVGIPLVTSLRKSGWTDEELEQLEEDQNTASAAQSASLATALLTAQEQYRAGQQSNGLEGPAPQPPQQPPVDENTL